MLTGNRLTTKSWKKVFLLFVLTKRTPHLKKKRNSSFKFIFHLNISESIVLEIQQKNSHFCDFTIHKISFLILGNWTFFETKYPEFKVILSKRCWQFVITWHDMKWPHCDIKVYQMWWVCVSLGTCRPQYGSLQGKHCEAWREKEVLQVQYPLLSPSLSHNR